MGKKLELTAADLRGVNAYMVTPIKDEPVTRHSRNMVNIDEAVRLADALTRDGVNSITLNGTFGELPSLMLEEVKAFTAAVVEGVRGRVPVFAGATTLNTRDTIEKARMVLDVGATGLNLGRPMLSPLSDANIIRYYRDVTEEFPHAPVIVYDDPEAFKRPITAPVWSELAKMPQIIGAKYRTRLLMGSLAQGTYTADMKAVGNKIQLMTMPGDWPIAHKLYGTTAVWTSDVNIAGPTASLVMAQALEEGNYDLAFEIAEDYEWASEGLIPKGDFALWHMEKIPTMKRLMAAGGYSKPGPSLPPYIDISPERIEAAERVGKRFCEMRDKYAPLLRKRAAAAE